MTEDEFRKKDTADAATKGRQKIIQRCNEAEYHPSVVAVMQFFHYEHLPPHLAAISERFYRLAFDVAGANSPQTAETTVALRKLLEAKDAAVRAALPVV